MQNTNTPVRAKSASSPWSQVCPVQADRPDDALVVTTTRRMLRVATVAADVGARFARDGVKHDPVVWLLAPRDAFGRTCALDACQSVLGFNRAVALGTIGRLDASPDELDELIAADDDADEDNRNGTPMQVAGTLLYTTTLVENRATETRYAYHAVVAPTPEHAARCLLARLEGTVAGVVTMIVGFDRSLPIAQALVSDAVAEMLRMIDEDPTSPIAQGLDLFLEQRFTW